MCVQIDVFKDCNMLPTFKNDNYRDGKIPLKRQGTLFSSEYRLEGNLRCCRSGEVLFLGSILGFNFVFYFSVGVEVGDHSCTCVLKP